MRQASPTIVPDSSTRAPRGLLHRKGPNGDRDWTRAEVIRRGNQWFLGAEVMYAPTYGSWFEVSMKYASARGCFIVVQSS